LFYATVHSIMMGIEGRNM